MEVWLPLYEEAEETTVEGIWLAAVCGSMGELTQIAYQGMLFLLKNKTRSTSHQNERAKQWCALRPESESRRFRRTLFQSGSYWAHGPDFSYTRIPDSFETAF